MNIIGISAFYHDSAAAFVQDGVLKVALQEERFTRKKFDSRFPIYSIESILKKEDLDISQIDYFVFYEKPTLKFDRIVESFIAVAPRGVKQFSGAMTLWMKEKLLQKQIIKNHLIELGSDKKVEDKIVFAEHHLSHAASAFYPSPFEEAVIVTMDGVGEWATTSISLGKGNRIERLYQLDFPHSLGLLYSAFTAYCGFKVNSGEYKLMGLAPYGNPVYRDLILRELVDIVPDGSFRLNMTYFGYLESQKMFNKKFCELFGSGPRKIEDEISQFYMDIAASIQQVTEIIVLNICKFALELSNSNNICLAGGVALNCVANSKILDSIYPKKLWIQPAAGDAGGAVGAALSFYHSQASKVNHKSLNYIDGMQGAFLGTQYSDNEVRSIFEQHYLKYIELKDEDLYPYIVNFLLEGKAIGWFQGRMEFGPRALGNRSILADPRNINTQQQLNLKTKFRESFRPFAPAVLEENFEEWFSGGAINQYMLLIAQVLEKHRDKSSIQNISKIEGLDKLKLQRSNIPAVTHVDFSARVQAVSKSTNPKFHRLIQEFAHATGTPMLVNTSFNVRGEPIVESPLDALRCFAASDIEVLVVENFVVTKSMSNNLTNLILDRNFEAD
jgi:carbamoyltransferase